MIRSYKQLGLLVGSVRPVRIVRTVSEECEAELGSGCSFFKKQILNESLGLLPSSRHFHPPVGVTSLSVERRLAPSEKRSVDFTGQINGQCRTAAGTIRWAGYNRRPALDVA